MKQGKQDIVELAQAIQHEADNKVDYVTPSQNMSVSTNGSLSVTLAGTAGGVTMPLSKHASRQLGSKFGIPAKYFDKMLKDAPDLLVHNANHWLQNEPKDLMIRSLFGNVRGILSNRYQRIDNVNVAEEILPFLLSQKDKGLEIVSSEITEQKLYIKAVMHSLTREVKVGDVVEAGIWIANSEIGCGEFEIAPFIHRLICLNGQKVNDASFGKRHVGGRANVNDDTYRMLSDETLKADDKAFMLKARDVVKAAFDEEWFDIHVNKLRKTTDNMIHGNPVKAVEVLGQTSGLLQGEQEGILRKLITGADLSQYGLVQAITSYSQDVESYDRASDLEELGGKVVDLNPQDWNQIAIAA